MKISRASSSIAPSPGVSDPYLRLVSTTRLASCLAHVFDSLGSSTSARSGTATAITRSPRAMSVVAINPRTPSAFAPHRTRADAPTASRRRTTAASTPSLVVGADETLDARETRHQRAENVRTLDARARRTDARVVTARIARVTITMDGDAFSSFFSRRRRVARLTDWLTVV